MCPLSGMSVRRYAWNAGGSGVTLSGTSGSPNLSTRTTTGFAAATCLWAFNTDGTVDRNENSDTLTQFQDGVEWDAEQDSPTQEYWLRATLDSGNSPTSGSSLNTWHKISGSGSAGVQFIWTAAPPSGSQDGTLKIEIASDSGGSTIVATGYYRGDCQVV